MPLSRLQKAAWQYFAGLEERYRRGILLGHIISQEGMTIDSRKIEAIQKAPQPQNLKELNLQFLKSPPIRTKNKENRTAHYLNATKKTPQKS